MFMVFLRRYGIYMLFVFLSLSFIYSSQNYKKSTQTEIAYSDFKKFIAAGGIKSVSFSGDQVRAVLHSGSQLPGVELKSQFIRTHIPIVGDEDLLSLLEAQDVEVNVSAVQEKGGISTLLSMLPFIFFVAYASGSCGAWGRVDLVKTSE